MLRIGECSESVFYLNKRLKERGYDVDLDNSFTDKTLKAVLLFQNTNNLVADGIVGRKTNNALSNRDSSKYLSLLDMKTAAASLGCELAVILAVNEVETLESGFLFSGLPVILFERHIMRRQLLTNKSVELSDLSLAEHRWPDLVNQTPGGYLGGVREHEKLERACEIDKVSALESCSWGQFQIMGFHWRKLGYASIDQFVELMSKNEQEQLKAFVKFIELDRNLSQALKNKDWSKFARAYNGKNYRINNYDKRLERAYAYYSGLL